MARNPQKHYNHPPITADQYNTIIDMLRTSCQSVATACKRTKIGVQSFYDFKKDNPEAEEKYARAKSEQIDTLVDQIDELNDECQRELKSLSDNRLANALVSFYKMKIDNLKWIASKLKPKKYGEKLDLSGNLKTEWPASVRIELVEPKKDEATH